jgi:hypothetical protein
MQKKTKRKYPLPSGHAGVYRSRDGKCWEAYVLTGRAMRRLGAYASIRDAVRARAKYWASKTAPSKSAPAAR